jgi:hypothetical protein
MRIPISRVVPEATHSATVVKIGEAEVVLDHEFGWLCGMYLADGSFNGNSVNISKVNPVVEEKLKMIGEFELVWQSRLLTYFIIDQIMPFFVHCRKLVE